LPGLPVNFDGDEPEGAFLRIITYIISSL
jgi:hypothetical protein